MKHLFISLLLATSLQASPAPFPLFNGKDFTGWTAEDPHKHDRLKKDPQKLAAYKKKEAANNSAY